MSTEKELSRPHDSFFKKLMGNIDNVRDFLKGFLPDEVASKIDYESLRIIDTEKEDIKYKKYLLDLVVEGNISDTKGQIYIVFEHKSYADKFTFIQILRYCTVIWEKYIKEKRALVPIIPIIFYHGKKKFDLPVRFIDYFKGIDPALKRYVVDFEIELFDTNKYEDKAIVDLFNNLYLKSGILAMKHIFEDIRDIKPVFKQVLNFGKEGFMMVLEYVVMSKKISEEEIEEILKEGGIIMPSLARKWFEQGKQEGIQLGEQRGIQKGIYLGLIQEARNMVLDAYRTKFGKMDKNFQVRVEKISDREVLKNLMRKILLATSKKDVAI